MCDCELHPWRPLGTLLINHEVAMLCRLHADQSSVWHWVMLLVRKVKRDSKRKLKYAKNVLVKINKVLAGMLEYCSAFV